MCFRFVPLSSLARPEVVPNDSPLYFSWMEAKTMSDPNNISNSLPRIPPNLLLVGLLLVKEHRTTGSRKLVRTRQEPVFCRNGILGIFVPFDWEIHDYAGVYLYGAKNANVDNFTQVVNTVRAIASACDKDFLPTVVEFYSFDSKYANSSHLDRVRNMELPYQNQPSQETDSCLFYLSNLCYSLLENLREHYVGHIELESRKWPIFIDAGYLCLKLDSLDSLLTNFPFWIDEQYRIHLGRYSPQVKSRPVIHFTTMRINMPTCFEYATSYADHLAPLTMPNLSHVEQSKMLPPGWELLAGKPFVSTSNNCIASNGRMPNFPVRDSRPSIHIDKWLPSFVQQAIGDAKKCHLDMVTNMNAVGADSESSASLASTGSNKNGAKKKTSKEKGR